MKNNNLYLGNTLLDLNKNPLKLETVSYADETYFKMENYDKMDSFFMTIVSDIDFWFYASSKGGVTIGRKNPESALFPYYTDDKIHDSNETTGSHTMLIITKEDKNYFWEPFTTHNTNVYSITRNLYKNSIGNKLMFEEINHDLETTFSYIWKTSDRYGVIKESKVVNNSEQVCSVRVLDGIRNLLPSGVNTLLQTTRSTLVDGYKRCELLEDAHVGIYTLSSILTDKAEPSESLKSTTVWSKGLDNPVVLLSEIQVKNFCSNQEITTEKDIKGRRGAYYVSEAFELSSDKNKQWIIVSELNQSACKVESLAREILQEDDILSKVNEDVLKGDINLQKLVFDSDGLQHTANSNASFRHFSNTLYNIMRGGIYAYGYDVDTKDYIEFIKTWNKLVYVNHINFMNLLEDRINYNELLTKVSELNDTRLHRLTLEYLPLTYSRRHGDPSRPWNKFNIDISKENGEKNLNFEGNWRDIFQNWEALSMSYPAFIESIISKFVNASTPDGYNPYRITKEGIDWELLDLEDPWSNIGYWGDHQIIYLLRLMELSKKYSEDKLNDLLSKEYFTYANVPYRIKGFDDLVKDPRNSILFDDDCQELVSKRVARIGTDGKLIFVNDEIYQVNLMEKLIVTMLSKLSNYIPEGGIWMNTQRPEWNDANNALVGNGISMVTLYYLHRFLGFMEEITRDLDSEIKLSAEVKQLFDKVLSVLKENTEYLGEAMSDNVRYKIVSSLGRINETYRDIVYKHGFSGEKEVVSTESIRDFIETSMAHLKHTISMNKRKDGLYHSYNIVKFEEQKCRVSNLYEMLEGQVAVLSSNALSLKETLDVLKALRSSSMYREDQNSYMLYPNRELPRFLDKNIIQSSVVETSKILKSELEKGLTRFIEVDINGIHHFNAEFRNSEGIMEAISKTKEYSHEDIMLVGEIFTELFDHNSFTGRSGTFYKYEGLGCIYWHMVSKLALSTQECFSKIVSNEGMSDETHKLAEYFHDLKAGIGADKLATEYGAFPTDAYSHTPGFAGVQQPGMTGQVKEDIISRFGELGVNVDKGKISFNPLLLSKSEFFNEKKTWELPNERYELNKGQLGFTFCSLPIIYTLKDDKSITVYYENGDTYRFEKTFSLNKEISKSIFQRDGKISKIVVEIDEHYLKEYR